MPQRLPEITMPFYTRLTDVFVKLFSSPKDIANYGHSSETNADPEQLTSQADDDSAPEVTMMGLRPIPRHSRRPQTRRGRAGSW